MSYHLLENAPDHQSAEFIDYLRENNPVVFEDKVWIVIENVKYHTAHRAWYTAFHKTGPIDVTSLSQRYGDLEWRKKTAERQSVKRFHIHMYEK